MNLHNKNSKPRNCTLTANQKIQNKSENQLFDNVAKMKFKTFGKCNRQSNEYIWVSCSSGVKAC